MTTSPTALITGVTGYVGSRLAPRLLHEGWRLRLLTRDADRLQARAWFAAGRAEGRLDVVEGDGAARGVLAEAARGADVGYYLVHSMDGQGDFVARDRALAETFGQVARESGLGRIVYLSGLHPDEPLSDHLASRVEVGELLMASGVPTAVLQAGIIVGSGSASFEMLRHLTERLPVMVAPRWLDNRIQPIAIRDVLTYLVGAAGLAPDENRTFDIGGPQVLSYREMIDRFALVEGLFRRRILTLPVLSPRLASYWVGLVTPVPLGIAEPLVGSLIHDLVCAENDLAHRLGLEPGGFLDFESAVREALSEGPTRSEPGADNPARLTAADPAWAGSRRRLPW